MTITVRWRISRGEQTSLRMLAAPAWPGERPGYGHQHGARLTCVRTHNARALCLTTAEGETQANFFGKAEAIACSGEAPPLGHLPLMKSYETTFVCGGTEACMVGDSTHPAKRVRRAVVGIPRRMGVSMLGAVVDVVS